MASIIPNVNIDTTKLLQLLAFLNPDGVLIEFIHAGNKGLTPDLYATIVDTNRFYEALSNLERFSLVGRQNDRSSGQRITIGAIRYQGQNA
jgi:hypothetical protein